LSYKILNSKCVSDGLYQNCKMSIISQFFVDMPLRCDGRNTVQPDPDSQAAHSNQNEHAKKPIKPLRLRDASSFEVEAAGVEPGRDARLASAVPVQHSGLSDTEVGEAARSESACFIRA
jgi:hypothetical protein